MKSINLRYVFFGGFVATSILVGIVAPNHLVGWTLGWLIGWNFTSMQRWYHKNKEEIKVWVRIAIITSWFAVFMFLFYLALFDDK